MGIGIGATAVGASAAITDVAICNEVETRATGAETISSAVYQSQGTSTATATRVVDETGMYDTASQSTTSTGAAQSATTLPLASGVFAATGTAYSANGTTAASSPQTITITGGGNTTSATVSALAGAVTAGNWVYSGNLFAHVTLISSTITLNSGDSLQVTYQVTFTTSTT